VALSQRTSRVRSTHGGSRLFEEFRRRLGEDACTDLAAEIWADRPGCTSADEALDTAWRGVGIRDKQHDPAYGRVLDAAAAGAGPLALTARVELFIRKSIGEIGDSVAAGERCLTAINDLGQCVEINPDLLDTMTPTDREHNRISLPGGRVLLDLRFSSPEPVVSAAPQPVASAAPRPVSTAPQRPPSGLDQHRPEVDEFLTEAVERGVRLGRRHPLGPPTIGMKPFIRELCAHCGVPHDTEGFSRTAVRALIEERYPELFGRPRTAEETP
jgi:hypothetical protein